MRRVWRLLRSRRLALSLMTVLVAYVAASTAIPHASNSPQRYAAWARSGTPFVPLVETLGLDRPYSSPFFLLLISALALSTVACSIERTSLALKLVRRRGLISASTAERLELRPELVVTRPRSVDGAVAEALRGLRMRTRVGPAVGFADAGVLGLLGSPLFHWSLALFIIIAGTAQMTRWDGRIGVPVGGRAIESAESYGVLDPGALAPPHTGWSLQVPSAVESLTVEGISHGFVPRVRVVSDGRVIADGDVYANHALRAGPLEIHHSGHGLVVGVTVLDEGGSPVGRDTTLIDFADSGMASVSAFDVTDDAGSLVASIAISVPTKRGSAGERTRMLPRDPVAVVVAQDPEGNITTQSAAPGGIVGLPRGWSLRLDTIGYYARLSVIRDWSVPWLFALMGTAGLGLALTSLMPYRAIWYAVKEIDGVTTFKAITHHHSRDPSFAASIEEAVGREFDAGGGPA